LSSPTGKLISEKYFAYRSVQMCRIPQVVAIFERDVSHAYGV